MVAETRIVAAEARLVELVRLNERPHRPVDDEDPLGEQRRQERGAFLAGSRTRRPFDGMAVRRWTDGNFDHAALLLSHLAVAPFPR
jgi:hypothetical protein